MEISQYSIPSGLHWLHLDSTLDWHQQCLFCWPFAEVAMRLAWRWSIRSGTIFRWNCFGGGGLVWFVLHAVDDNINCTLPLSFFRSRIPPTHMEPFLAEPWWGKRKVKRWCRRDQVLHLGWFPKKTTATSNHPFHGLWPGVSSTNCVLYHVTSPVGPSGCTTPPESSQSCNAGPLPSTKYVQDWGEFSRKEKRIDVRDWVKTASDWTKW